MHMCEIDCNDVYIAIAHKQGMFPTKPPRHITILLQQSHRNLCYSHITTISSLLLSHE